LTPYPSEHGGKEEVPLTSDHLITPHGGTLVDLVVEDERHREIEAASQGWPSWDLTSRQLCDLELLLCGAFSPLRGFMGRSDWESVCSRMRLGDDTLWPIPVTLDVDEATAQKVGPDSTLALRDPEGTLIAALHVVEVWRRDREAEAQAVYGTLDQAHPGVRALTEETNGFCVAGTVEGIELPRHYDFKTLRFTPRSLREEFVRRGWRRVVAFQTRNPMHRAHLELTRRAAAEVDANLLVHPVVGMTKPGDIDHFTRVRCYEALLPHYPPHTAVLALLPLAMRMAGPREAVWHAIIRKNYGCSHLIVGRDHAGPGTDGAGKPFYPPYAAQELILEHAEELGVGVVPFRQLVYVVEDDTYEPIDDVPVEKHALSISGTELRQRLSEGRGIPTWFTFPEVAKELRRTHPPRSHQGFTVFFTGLSGAGKSTLAQVLQVRLLEIGGRPVTLLDGDLVRRHLSSELGFSKEHRDLNIRRIGFVAAEITKNGGIALCAPIAPYDAVRKEVRTMICPHGGFVLVYVATPLAECERRDRKGLYARARAGLVKQFTGISDPYEPPEDAEVVVDTTNLTPDEAATEVLLHLEREGYLGAERSDP
jgi:sulfate adenylyltransferase